MSTQDIVHLESILSKESPRTPPFGLPKWPLVEVVATILKEKYGWAGRDTEHRPDRAYPSPENKQFEVEFMMSMQKLGCFLKWREWDDRVLWDWNGGLFPYKLPANMAEIKNLTSAVASEQFERVYGSVQPMSWQECYDRQMEVAIQRLQDFGRQPCA
jgi:hypothetical protein